MAKSQCLISEDKFVEAMDMFVKKGFDVEGDFDSLGYYDIKVTSLEGNSFNAQVEWEKTKGSAFMLEIQSQGDVADDIELVLMKVAKSEYLGSLVCY